ncbi:MAG: hypothetical protein J6W82_09035 [Bacteroidales bacterium]|nr:hypothetical protein [Bacteroidales bacterium]
MKTNYTLFAALLALALFSASAGAQQPARRNSAASSRQDNKVERQQTKVDNVQRPTNLSNQNATDHKVREANGGGSATHRGSVSDGSRASSAGSGSGNKGNAGNYNGNGNQRPPANGGYGSNHGNGQRPPANGGYNNGNQRPPVQGGYENRPPAGFDPNRRSPVPSVYNYTRMQLYERTNANSIVVNTVFRTKAEAYDYIARLLNERYYTIGSYGNNYNWIRSEVSYIPTPFDWTNPMTHNQFKMEFNISKIFGTVRVQITAYWRESILSDSFTRLRFQPSDSYSTYYAWRVLEDFAENLPHTSISYN